jgi:hypothetical protein
MIKDSIETYKKIANKRGGVCLSKKYLNQQLKLDFKCSSGHVFSSLAGNVKRGSWCPSCARIKTNKALQSRKPTIKEIELLAHQRDGQLVTKVYKNRNEKLEWVCNLGHTFFAPYGNVLGTKNRMGTWCPHCKGSLGEKLLRVFLEYIFKKPFPKSYPKWLKYKNKQLELDGFNEILKIAFEHHGVFHYSKTTFFEKKMSFKRRQEFDTAKSDLCRKKGIKLIVIPELNSLLNAKDLPQYLTTEFIRLGIKKSVPQVIPPHLLSASYKQVSFLEKYKEHLKKKQLQVLTESWFGFHHYYEHLCLKCNFHFSAKAANIYIVNTGCKYCTKSGRKDLNYLIQIAEKNKGTLISREYKGLVHKYSWKCQNGHDFILSGTDCSKKWCNYCNSPTESRDGILRHQRNQIYTIKEVKTFVKNKHNGNCTSLEYINARSKLTFTCSKKHQWDQTFDLILTGKWCPHCSGNAKGTIEQMCQIAKERQGKCLSKKYINSQTKLKWQCNQGHAWEAVPSSIKLGTWCAVCAREKRRKK